MRRFRRRRSSEYIVRRPAVSCAAARPLRAVLRHRQKWIGATKALPHWPTERATCLSCAMWLTLVWGRNERRAPGYGDYRKGCGELVIMGSRPAAVSNCGWAAGGTWAATPAISVG